MSKTAYKRKVKWKASGGVVTAAQDRVLQAVKRLIAEHHFPPTRSEIAKEMGLYPNAVQEHLEALAKKGAITLYKGLSRGIIIKEETNDSGHANP